MLFFQKYKTSILVLFTFSILLIYNDVLAQKETLPMGYYINLKGEKIKGFFNLDFIRQNRIKISDSEDISSGKNLDIESISKIVIFKEKGDSSVILTQNLDFNNEKEKIFLENLLVGEVNLFRGFPKKGAEIYFINSIKFPDIRRINRADPKSFLSVYFKECKDAAWKLKNVIYSKESLSWAIWEMNKCLGNNNITLLKDGQVHVKRKFAIGFKTFGGFIKPQIEHIYFNQPYKTRSISGGLGFNFQYNISNILTISSELNYSSNRITSPDSIEQWVDGDWFIQYLFRAKPTIAYKSIEFIPFEIKYNLHRTNEKFVPIFSVGMIYNKLIGLNLDGDYNKNYSQYRPKPNYPASIDKSVKPEAPHIDKIFANNGFGYFVTAAVQKPINSSLSLSFGIKYTRFRNTIYINSPNLPIYDYNFFIKRVNGLNAFAHLLYTFR